MKKIRKIYEEGNHKWMVVARDPDKPDYVIDTNEYLIAHDSALMLLDPGGMEIFPAVFSAISEEFDPAQINKIFASHQDPDIISSLSLWLETNPDVKCYLSWLWTSFVPHFGGKDDTFIHLPDDGQDIDLNGLRLQAIPAHFLHSAGNFHLYDPVAKILFSGDVGAAMVPHDESEEVFVENFDEHIKYAEGFHRRWMGSNEAKLDWCQRVSQLDIDMLCPQHGGIYKGENVQRFINWFADLPVGFGNYKAK